MAMTGRCQCGGVVYHVASAPKSVYVCHCRECRRQSSSAFGISVIVHAADVTVLSGTLGLWSRPTESGGTLECRFCTTCGSRLFHAAPGEDVVSVKGGSLDAPPDLTGATHIWTNRKLAGVAIPSDSPQYAEEPP